MRHTLAAGVAGAVLLLLSGCRLASSQSDFYAMDTFMTVTAYDTSEDTAEQTRVEIERQINALDQLMSRQREESDLSRLNAAGGAPVTVAHELYEAIETAVSYAELTGGAYDPTTAPLSDLWGIGTDAPHVPGQAEIDAALQKVGWQNIHLLGNDTIQLTNGAQVDLGGIGKGWAANDTAEICRVAGDTLHVLAQLGGNIYGVGENPNSDTGDWLIGIADPDASANSVATISITDESVVTSGDYERYFIEDGKRYHHIFDPKTGYPADNGLRSVTVVDADSAKADAMTTGLFVMGLEQGLEFCKEHDIKAVFITADKQIIPAETVLPQYDFCGAEAGYTDAR